MLLYQKFLTLIIIFIIFISILTFFKKMMMYYPVSFNKVKYLAFYKKILDITEDEKNIINATVVTCDGENLDTIYLKNSSTNKCIIICHGNAGNISMRIDLIKFLYNYASVIIFDYRSYGKSSGISSDLSFNTLQTDTKAIWDFATNRLKIHPNDISLFGESLGCSLVLDLASNLSKTLDTNQYPHSIILNSPFYSLSEMISHIFQKINLNIISNVLSLILGREYTSDEYIKYINYSTKILIAHSPRDETIPYKQAKKLFSLIESQHPDCKFINVTGTHNTLGLTDEYIYALAGMFNE